MARLITRLKDAGLGSNEVIGRINHEVAPRDLATASPYDSGLGDPHTPGARKPEPCRSTAVIDGPSLAHYIFRLCEDANEITDHHLSPATTYDDCAVKAVRWLRDLRAFGFDMYVLELGRLVIFRALTTASAAIFFDGMLPAAKKGIRVSRMQGYVNNQKLFHSLHEDAQKLCQQPGPKSQSIWKLPQLRAARRSLPPPPFLVAAVLEAIIDSEFNETVYMVPDEADRFCVAAALDLCSEPTSKGVNIFTNDSDLIIFDSGDRTRIVLFNELRMQSNDHCTELSSTVFWPARIRSTCPDLLQAAFHMAQNPKLSFGQVQEYIMPPEQMMSLDAYKDFHNEYQLDTQTLDYHRLKMNSQQRLLLCSLDPRVSEIVYEAKALESDPSKTEVDVYLPFVLEDPQRRSAWHVGSRFRHSAYALLLLHYAHQRPDIVVNEWRRSGPGVTATKLRDLCSLKLVCELHSFIQSMEGVALQHTELTEVERWRLFVLRCMLINMAEKEMPAPLPEQLIVILRSGSDYGWQVAQILALYSATYHSLRMLKQILHYVSSLRELTVMKSRLGDCLRDLPGVADFFASDGLSEEKGSAKWSQLISDSLEGLHRPVETELNAKKKDRRRRSRAKDVSRMETVEESGVEAAARSSNPFAALTAE